MRGCIGLCIKPSAVCGDFVNWASDETRGAATGVKTDMSGDGMSNGTYISQTGLKPDNVENPVFFLPNVEISATLRIYQLLKDIGPGAADKQERGIMYGWRGVAGTHTRLTHTEGNDSPGIENQEDGLERKTGFCLCMRQRQTKIEVLTASSIQTRWERLSSFAL